MPETIVVSADGTKLRARCSGKGTPLVLVHGALGNIDSFALCEEQLAARHAVWVFSRRGRGGSGDGPSYSLEREAEDVLAVLATAGSGAHLFGHSSGGVYSILAAGRARSLRTLSVYEPPLFIERADARAFAGVDAALAAGDPDRAIETFLPVAGITADELNAVRSHEDLWAELRRGVLVFPREHRALRDERRASLAAAELPDIPLLYLYGELTRAPVYPSLAEVGERWPEVRLECLPGQRHLATVFDPSGFADKLLAFTAAHDD